MAGHEARQTLSEACAPFFLLLATFRRNADASKLTAAELRETLERTLAAVRDECERDPRLRSAFDRAHYALVAAADQVVLSSSWAHRGAWSRSPFERHVFKSMEGGERFYRVVDEVLGDPGDTAVEVAECLFVCMGLGFQGELHGERKEYERVRRQLFEKARLAGALGEHLAPEAYGKNSPRRVERLPTVNLLRLVAVVVGSLIFAWLSFEALTHLSYADVEKQIQNVRSGDDGREAALDWAKERLRR